MTSNYSIYKNHLQKLADVSYASAVLQWDQEVYMPNSGAEIRARQLATLSGIAHEMSIEENFGKILEKLQSDDSLSPKEKRNVQQSWKDYIDRKKYTTAFVEKMSYAISEAFNAWQEAKDKNDYKIYAPKLEKIIGLKREEAEILGYEKHPYDSMLNQYEPGLTTQEVSIVFDEVKSKLTPFVQEIFKKQKPNDSFMFGNFDEQKQWDLGIELLQQMGYDFEAGRQDKSSHPFTTSFNSKDVRVTTRISKTDFSEMIWSTIHEGGHALYEQGLPLEEYGLPCGEAISLGIHESQSRLWENNVGRSLNYWKANWNKVTSRFPNEMKNVSPEDFYKAMNLVQPSLIRTNADELTYHFHIMIRFEMEKAMMEGNVHVNDLPEKWNSLYKQFLQIDVPSDKEGILQDIHWSHGSIGYFPTYSLGSFYAAQFYAKAQTEISGLENEIGKGNMKPLFEWLRVKIHQHGKMYSAQEICQLVTGEKLNFDYFMEYAQKKYTDIYQL
jgi:carboxypeptidase Taq